jgi:hypothetical protein
MDVKAQLAQHVGRDGANMGLVIDEEDNSGFRVGGAKAGGALFG